MQTLSVILDTNVFVAAGFNRKSASAQILAAIRDGQLLLVWNEETRIETRRILSRIPPLSWSAVEPLFAEEGGFDGETRPEEFAMIRDPDDRKFAALAAATGAVLVTSDDHLLAHRDHFGSGISTPGEFLRRYPQLAIGDS